MAHSGPDGAGTGAGRVYARTPDHGHPVRGLYRCLERSRPLLTPALRDAWSPYHYLRDVLALLSVYLPPGTLHRAPGQRPQAQGDPNWGYGGGRRCDRQPGRLLRHAGSVPGGHLPGRPRHLRAGSRGRLVRGAAEVQGPDLPDGAGGRGVGDGMDPAVKVAWGREGPGRPRQGPPRPADDANIRGRQERGASW